MARKRYSNEDVLKLLREIELKLSGGGDVRSACRSVPAVSLVSLSSVEEAAARLQRRADRRGPPRWSLGPVACSPANID